MLLLDFTLHDSFYLEQTLLGAFSFTLLVLFVAQIYSEQFQTTPVVSTNVKFKLHRLGVIICSLLIAITIDPFGVHQIYSSVTVQWGLANVAAFLLCALIFLNQTALEVVYISSMKEVPKSIAFVSWTLAISTVVLCDVVYFFAWRTGHIWYAGIFHAFIALVFLVIVISFLSVTVNILSVMKKADVNSSTTSTGSIRRSRTAFELEQSRKVSLMKMRAFLVLVLGLVLVPALVIAALSRLSDKSAPAEDPDLDSFNVYDRVYLYLEMLCVLVLLWYSWIPLRATAYEKVPRSPRSSLSKRSWKVATRQRMRESESGTSGSVSLTEDQQAGREASWSASFSKVENNDELL